ncbi:ABC transporter substrate-binding protein [Geodermatophilus ruber]|uniref:Amino acid/amide ABC transporter substrate-binding protein, HAAT family n=1 Tax=Geodermatophilus ruber TaxID=504800 RepID=A0A1I4GXB4_9ACTN|nr:ABC transporter substrate-binding protein [Geodermatophilus ruber]SFL34073.1 amino acid/amide ABC transporter substrate-binding protein, HAAT family [Geodermatophilus ruber]
MTRTSRSMALASAGLLLLGVAACGDSRSEGNAAGGGGGQTNTEGRFVVDASACPEDATTALADGEPITIGTSQPLSGPLASGGAANVAGITAYFEKVNEAGGIAGHQLELVAKDDAYDAARAVTNAQSFVGEEQVFANLAQVGTPQIRATQPIYEQACVPQLWTITTGPAFTNPTEHEWTVNGIPPAPVEAKAMVDYIAEQVPGGSVTEIKGSDALSEDFHAALPRLAEDAGLTVQPAQTIPAGATNIDAQISAAVAGEPDAIVLEALPNYAPGFITGLARAGYEGLVVLNSSANGAAQWITPSDPAGEGVVAPLFRKDPSDTRWDGDPAMQEYLDDMAAAGQQDLARFGNALDGYGWAQLIVQNLTDAAEMDGGLTRANLMSAAWNTDLERPLMLHPEASTSGPDDPFIAESGEMASYSTETKGWVSEMEWDYSGTSGDIVGQG